MVITSHGIVRRQNSRECCYSVSCSIISPQCLRCLLCWSLCGGTVSSFRYATKYGRRLTLVVQGVKLKAVSDSSIFEEAHRLYYKGVFTRLLAVERTTSLLNSDIWRRPVCSAQSRVLKTLCTSNVWSYTAVRGVLVVFSRWPVASQLLCSQHFHISPRCRA
jgi:hypothetical protein